MWKRLLLLDLALAAVLAAGGLKLRSDWGKFEDAHRVESIQPESETPRGMLATDPAAFAVGDWTEIVAKNPFSFDRNDIAILAPPPPPPPVVAEATRVGPKPVLFGTFGIGTDWQALLASGQAGQASNRRSRPMKVGETIDGWQLVEIHEKTVVVTSGVARETISIDTAIQTSRDTSRTIASSAAAAPVVIQTSQPAAASASGTNPAAAPNSNSCIPDENPKGKGHYLETPFGKKCIEDK